MNTNIKMAKVITVTTARNPQGKTLKIVTTVAANADLKLLLLRMGLAPELVTCEVSNIMLKINEKTKARISSTNTASIPSKTRSS